MDHFEDIRMIFGHVFFPFFFVEKMLQNTDFYHHPIHYLSFSPGKQSSSMRKGQRRSGNRRGFFFTGFLMTKKKNGMVPKVTNFLLLCELKKAFFFTAKDPPHKWWKSMGNGLSNTSSNYFGKIGYKRPYRIWRYWY